MEDIAQGHVLWLGLLCDNNIDARFAHLFVLAAAWAAFCFGYWGKSFERGFRDLRLWLNCRDRSLWRLAQLP